MGLVRSRRRVPDTKAEEGSREGLEESLVDGSDPMSSCRGEIISGQYIGLFQWIVN